MNTAKKNILTKYAQQQKIQYMMHGKQVLDTVNLEHFGQIDLSEYIDMFL